MGVPGLLDPSSGHRIIQSRIEGPIDGARDGRTLSIIGSLSSACAKPSSRRNTQQVSHDFSHLAHDAQISWFQQKISSPARGATKLLYSKCHLRGRQQHYS
jgi:hypothetical protein